MPTRFCNYIGIDYIANSIHMLEGTIDRMQMVANDMSDIIKKVELRTEMASRLSIVSTFKQRLDDNDIELKKLKTCMSHYTKAIEKSVTT